MIRNISFHKNLNPFSKLRKLMCIPYTYCLYAYCIPPLVFLAFISKIYMINGETRETCLWNKCFCHYYIGDSYCPRIWCQWGGLWLWRLVEAARENGVDNEVYSHSEELRYLLSALRQRNQTPFYRSNPSPYSFFSISLFVCSILKQCECMRVWEWKLHVKMQICAVRNAVSDSHMACDWVCVTSSCFAKCDRNVKDSLLCQDLKLIWVFGTRFEF